MTINNPMLIERIIWHLVNNDTSTVERIAADFKMTPDEIQDEMDKYPYTGEREPLTHWATGTITLAHPYPGSRAEEYQDFVAIRDLSITLTGYQIDITPTLVANRCNIDLDRVLAILYNNPGTFKYQFNGSFTYIPGPGDNFSPAPTGAAKTSTRVGTGLSRPVSYLTEMGERVAEVNDDNGWFDNTRTFGEDIALLHSEVSEALEAYRSDGLKASVSEKGKPEGVASELADVLIRLLDTCYRYEIDLEAEFNAKLAYNATRSHRHGDKLI